ncbi:hypothetical protein APHAL10511_001636 [Amanita phalloides]|nr:hypothetical protein APHAL10511_001636 [Amanita phalloides]
MSFSFNWPHFSDQFHHDAIQMLNNALNKGNKPPVIVDKIEVVELHMGTQPPELEIRDIGDLAMDHFRGIFRLTYAGDAHLVLKTKVQANPLNHKQPDIHLMTGSRGILAAKQPLVVPMLLRLSHFRLNSYVVLVVSKQKGITLVFKTDPLQNVDINSTFDSIAVIQKFIQREIEGQLRQMFREDLPGIIHRLSQQWVKSKVEAPYLTKRPPLSMRQPTDAVSMPELSHDQLGGVSGLGARQVQRPESLGVPAEYRRPRSVSGVSLKSTSRTPKPDSAASPNSRTSLTTIQPEQGSFPDIENYDPTYGLRPEGLPTKSGFRHFSSLFTPNKGLASLAEELNDTDEYDDDDDGMTSFDMVDWDDTVPEMSPAPSVASDRESVAEYETIPAVGGGTITRPRIVHAQSRIQPVGSSTMTTPSPSLSPQAPGSGTMTTGPSARSRRAGSLYGSYFPDTPHSAPPFPSDRNGPTHDDVASNGPLSTASEEITISSQPRFMSRRLSVSSSVSMTSQAPYTFSPGTSPPGDATTLSISHSSNIGNPKIVLRPSLITNTIRHLSTLSHSNHTLSPYTRSLAHFTVRSVPPRPLATSLSSERQPVKAKRKRTYRLGGNKQLQKSDSTAPVKVSPTDHDHDMPPTRPSSPTSPSEFDASDADFYFRPHNDQSPSSRQPSIHHLRERHPTSSVIPQRTRS